MGNTKCTNNIWYSSYLAISALGIQIAYLYWNNICTVWALAAINGTCSAIAKLIAWTEKVINSSDYIHNINQWFALNINKE